MADCHLEVSAPLIQGPPLSGSSDGDDVFFLPTPTDTATADPSYKIPLITQWCFVFLFLFYLALDLYLAPPWNHSECGFRQAIWPPVWCCLLMLQISVLLVVTHRRYSRLRVPRPTYYILRVLRLNNLIWFLYGIKPLFWDPPCNQTALRLGRFLWWMQAACFLLPLCFYISLCLCFPCLVILLRYIQEPPPNENPTPHWVIDKMEVRKYEDLLETLRAEFAKEVEFVPPAQQAINETVRQNSVVEAIAAAATAAVGVAAIPATSTATSAPPAAAAVGGGSQTGSPPKPPDKLLVAKCCPVCLSEFTSDDRVMVMPCDKRHFFHIDCVSQWLQNSQICPICRSNIVALTNTVHSSASSF